MSPHPYASVAGIPVMELLERKYGNATKAKEVMAAMVTGPGRPVAKWSALLKTGSASSPGVGGDRHGRVDPEDQKRVLPCCVYLNGEFGVKGVLRRRATVAGGGRRGEVIEFKLDAEEQAMMDKSVAAVKEFGPALSVAEPRTDRIGAGRDGLPLPAGAVFTKRRTSIPSDH